DIFKENPEDGKSSLHEEFRPGTDLGKGVVSDDHTACTEEAAAACPVQIITVEA
ncbi:MAG: ferredoxin, partial [Acidobacteria bacterium]